ncbi:O-antigen ligase family protein [Sphingobacterium sp. UBA7625]|nr:O-antigen ligase family protein [Sphingobacterium sp. UBA7625]
MGTTFNRISMIEDKWNIDTLYLLFILFVSPLLISIFSVLGLPSQIISYANTFLTLFFAVIVIYIRSTDQSRVVGIFKENFTLIVFFFVYIFHMIYDLYVINVKTDTFSDKSSYLLYTFFITLVPSIGIIFSEKINFKQLLKTGFLLLFMTLCFALWFNLRESNNLANELRSRSDNVMGPLTLGHYGVSFAIISMLLIIQKSNLKSKILYVFCLLFGLFAMYMAASRSPLVALFVCLSLIFFIQKGIGKGGVVLAMIILPFLFFGNSIISSLTSFNSSFVQRILLSLDKGDSSGRDIIYKQGMDQFFENPLFGGSFLINQGTYEGYYPHNMILEALMTTGLIGSFFFFKWLVRVLKSSFFIIKIYPNYSWIAVLFIQYCVFGLSSKSFYTNYLFWYYAFLTMNFFYNPKEDI